MLTGTVPFPRSCVLSPLPGVPFLPIWSSPELRVFPGREGNSPPPSLIFFSFFNWLSLPYLTTLKERGRVEELSARMHRDGTEDCPSLTRASLSEEQGPLKD